MLRKRTPQDAPLLDRQGSSLGSQPGVGLSGLNDDDRAVELRLTASCNGALGSVKIYTDASFSFSPHEDMAAKPNLLDQACCREVSTCLQVEGQDVVGATLTGSQGFQVWFCSKASRSQQKPVRKLQSSQVIETGSAEEARRCQSCLQQLASWGQKTTPRKLMVIINPKSGQGRSKAVFYSNKIQTIFKAAGLQLTVKETERAGHATDIVRAQTPGSCDAIVTVGGDGTVFEALQGLLKRADWQDAAHMPFAMLPTGSGNALSANTGMWDTVTAAWAICKGRTRPIDILSVLQPPTTRFYSFLSLNFGLISNLDIGTEHLRWMGNLRFTIGAIQQIFQGKTYQAHVAVVPHQSVQSSPEAAKDSMSDSNSQQGLRDERPPGPPVPLLDAFLSQTSSTAWPAQLPQGWEEVNGEALQLFAACNLPWLDTSFNLAPKADLNSGCLDLIYSGLAGKIEGLQIMTKIETGSHLDIPLVQCKKVDALVLEPVSTGTWLVLDGEAIPFQRVYAEVHPALCRVLVA